VGTAPLFHAALSEPDEMLALPHSTATPHSARSASAHRAQEARSASMRGVPGRGREVMNAWVHEGSAAPAPAPHRPPACECLARRSARHSTTRGAPYRGQPGSYPLTSRGLKAGQAHLTLVSRGFASRRAACIAMRAREAAHDSWAQPG